MKKKFLSLITAAAPLIKPNALSFAGDVEIETNASKVRRD